MKRFQFLVLLIFKIAYSQPGEFELNEGWKAKPKMEVMVDGNILTAENYECHGWLDAIVPGTVLTTLLANDKIPDPFYSPITIKKFTR